MGELAVQRAVGYVGETGDLINTPLVRGVNTHTDIGTPLVGGVAQWLGRRSVAGGLSLIYA